MTMTKVLLSPITDPTTLGYVRVATRVIGPEKAGFASRVSLLDTAPLGQ